MINLRTLLLVSLTMFNSGIIFAQSDKDQLEAIPKQEEIYPQITQITQIQFAE